MHKPNQNVLRVCIFLCRPHRLDRMTHTKKIAQIGAAIGREFSYELINVASDMQEKAKRECLNQLVEAELLLQRGVPPKATCKFRHALIRDAAYQSLLKKQQQTKNSELIWRK